MGVRTGSAAYRLGSLSPSGGVQLDHDERQAPPCPRPVHTPLGSASARILGAATGAPRAPRRNRKYRPPAPGAAVSSARIGRGGRQSPGGRGLAPGSGISGPHAGEGPAGLSSSQRPKATQQVPGPRRPGPPAPSPHAGYPFTPPSLPYPGQHQIEDAAVSGVKQAADRTSSGRAAEPPRALPRAPAFAKRCSPGSRVQPARAATEHRPFG